MTYPTLEQVEAADRVQLCRWYRFLPGPGMAAIDSGAETDICYAEIDREAKVMDRIVARHKELGGFSPEISKLIGWKE